jgi:O-antigen/teichoic acid export membrane protein
MATLIAIFGVKSLEERSCDNIMKTIKKTNGSPTKNVPKSRKFAIDVSWVLVAMIVDLGIGFFLKVILGNYFGATGLGAYSMVLVIYLIASILGGIGIPAALVKYIAEYKDRKSKFQSFVTCGVINSLILGGVVAAIIFITLINVLNGMRKMKLYAFAQIFRRASVLLFTAIFVWMGFGVAGAVWGLVVPAALTSGLIIIISRDFLKLKVKDFVKTSKSLFSFGSKVFAGNILSTINTRVDMLLIGFFLLDKDIGIYAVAVMFVHFMLVIPQAVQRITYPAIAELWAKKSKRSIENMINKCMKFTYILLTLAGILFFFFAEDIIRIIYFNRPDEFLPAVFPLKILVLAFVIRGPLVSVGAVFGSIGKPEISLYIIALITITNVILNIILIPMYGINGAAIATSFSFILSTVVGTYLREKILDINMIVIDSILVGWYPHLVVGIIGAAIYIGLILGTKIFGEEDRKLAKRILNLK